MAKVKFISSWTKGAGASSREVDIIGTRFAAYLSERQLWTACHLFTVEMVEFDENGDEHDGQVLTGTASSVRLARLAAERAVKRLASGGFEIVR